MSGFRNSAPTDTDAIFEPASSGRSVSASGYNGSAGVLTYCPLSFGSAAAATGMRISNGQDLSAIFAAKGSVAYLVPSASDTWQLVNNNGASAFHQDYPSDITYNISGHGIQSWNFGNGAIAYSGFGGYGQSSVNVVPGTGAYITLGSHNEGDTLAGYLQVNILANGTWTVVMYGSNGDLDHSSDGDLNNPDPAVTIGSGNWAENPAAGIGSAYNFSVRFNNQQHYAFFANGGNSGSGAGAWQFMNPGFSSVLGTAGVSESVSGTGMATTAWNGSTGLNVAGSGNLGGGASFQYNFSHTAAGATYPGNGSPGGDARGRDGAYRRLSSIDLSITISAVGGSASITGNLNLAAQMNWQDWSAKVGVSSPSPSPAPAPGGGGGGGCVTEESILCDGRAARDYVANDRHVSTHPYGERGETHSTVISAYSDAVRCWRIKTMRGGILDVSETALLQTQSGRMVRVTELMNHFIPVADKAQFQAHANGVDPSAAPVTWSWDQVRSVRALGIKPIRNLTMSQPDQGFWATSEPTSTLMVMHPNLKALP
jgi:hypothetical protein